MDDIKTAISVISFFLSLLAFMFTRKAWLENNRPIITAEVVTHSAGNVSIAYNLVVHNTGTRPAVDIHLITERRHLDKAVDRNCNPIMKRKIMDCFSQEGRIPLLHQQSKKLNAFGLSSINESENALIYNSVIPITITYKDLYGKYYKEEQRLIVKNTEYFAGSGWS